MRYFFTLLAVFVSSYVYSVDCSPLFKAIETQDLDGVITFFDDIDRMNLEEANQLVSRIYDHYTSIYGEGILENSAFKEQLLIWKNLYLSLLRESQVLIGQDCEWLQYSECGWGKNRRGNKEGEQGIEVPSRATSPRLEEKRKRGKA